MTVDRAVAVPPQSALQTALAGLIGNVLEWFDFAVYGYFACQADGDDLIIYENAENKKEIERFHFPRQPYDDHLALSDYYASVEKAGATIDVPLGDREYAMRDFHLIDPSGNCISFGQPLMFHA